jgi:hypothetical protein
MPQQKAETKKPVASSGFLFYPDANVSWATHVERG